MRWSAPGASATLHPLPQPITHRGQRARSALSLAGFLGFALPVVSFGAAKPKNPGQQRRTRASCSGKTACAALKLSCGVCPPAVSLRSLRGVRCGRCAAGLAAKAAKKKKKAVLHERVRGVTVHAPAPRIIKRCAVQVPPNRTRSRLPSDGRYLTENGRTFTHKIKALCRF